MKDVCPSGRPLADQSWKCPRCEDCSPLPPVGRAMKLLVGEMPDDEHAARQTEKHEYSFAPGIQFEIPMKPEPIDLPANLNVLILDCATLEQRMRALSKGLTYRGQLPAEPIGELNGAANQVKCARLFLADSLRSLKEQAK